jgi:hypothetical protein
MQNNEDNNTYNLPQGVAHSISNAGMQETEAGLVGKTMDTEGDIEMKDEAGEEVEVEEGPKVSLPWAFIDCEIDSLIELVGESFIRI